MSEDYIKEALAKLQGKVDELDRIKAKTREKPKLQLILYVRSITSGKEKVFFQADVDKLTKKPVMAMLKESFTKNKPLVLGMEAV